MSHNDQGKAGEVRGGAWCLMVKIFPSTSDYGMRALAGVVTYWTANPDSYSTRHGRGQGDFHSLFILWGCASMDEGGEAAWLCLEIGQKLGPELPRQLDAALDEEWPERFDALGPMCMPRSTWQPSVFAATAIMAATLNTRPSSRCLRSVASSPNRYAPVRGCERNPWTCSLMWPCPLNRNVPLSCLPTSLDQGGRGRY